MLKRNILANLGGSVWVAALTLLITPVQVHLLGIEAYGLIGFISTLQAVVSVLDFGLSSTIIREIAGDHSVGRRASEQLVRTAILVYWGMAAIIGAGIVLVSGVLAHHWFKADHIDMATLQRGLQVAAVYVALRWPISLYSGVLAGVQRMDVLNAIKAGAATLRLTAGVVVLLIWRDLTAFLLWFGISAVIEVAAHAYAARWAVPSMRWRPDFSLAALRGVWGFSSQMAALSALGMAGTQLGPVMISKMLPLEQLGFYSLAYTAGTGTSIIVSSLSTALMPSFASSHQAGARQTMLARYDSANEAMVYAAGFMLFPLVFFGRPLLSLWVSPAAAAGAWLPLALVAGGFWFSAAVANPYTISIASRRPTGILIISAFNWLLYASLSYCMIVIWGIDGVALSWLIFWIANVVAIVPFVHRRILEIPATRWFTRLLLPFAFVGFATFGLARAVALSWLSYSGIVTNLVALALAATAYSAVGYFLLGANLKKSMSATIQGATRIRVR